MGCSRRLNEFVFFKKAGQIKSKLVISLIVTMLIAAISPIVFASSDTIAVTFDPTGTIAIDVYPETASFGSVTFGSSNNWPTEGGTDTSYTVWNNGTITADVYIFSNTTTDSAQMTLDDDGAGIPVDGYSLNVTGGDEQQITNTNASWIDNLAASDHVTFGLNLALGSGSQDWTSQTTRINITATVN